MQKSKFDRILLIDLLYLGDLMFATPFIRNLRQNFPEAEIDMVVNANFEGIMADNPYLDQVYAYSKDWSIIDSWRFARQVGTNDYDLGLNIHGNWRTALLLKIVGPEYSVGFGTKGRGLFLDQSLTPPEDKHMVETYLHFLRQLGLSVSDDSLELGSSREAEKKMEDFLVSAGINVDRRVIALNTGGSWPTKRWPADKFARLADRIQREDVGQVVFLGGPTDVERVEKIRTMMETEAVSAAGETSLSELAALTSICELVVSTDSGPIHVAASVGTKTVAIFGPSDETKFRPYGEQHQVVTANVDCRPCGEHECPLEHHDCMEQLMVAQVIENLK